MDLMDEELRRVLAGTAEPVRRRVDAPPTAAELAAASRPSFRMSSAGRRAPEQRGGGEAIDSIAAGFLSSIPAGLAGLGNLLTLQGTEKAAQAVERVQDALAIDPETEGGVRAIRGIAEAFSPLGVIPKAAGEATLSATGSPLLATGAELLADPLNLLGIGATAKPIARGAAAAGRGAARAGRATAQSLGPKAAEMAESYMRRAGMMPDITVYHGTPHVFAPEEGAPLGRFRSEKIGTGEGAQAYGHGLYTAESKDLGNTYRRKLTGISGEPVSHPDQSIQVAIGRLKNQIRDLEKSDNPNAAAMIRAYQGRVDELDRLGSLYTIDLPDPVIDKMLDWDKPLSEQSQEIQNSITSALRVMKNPYPAYSDEKWLVGFGSTNMDDVVGAFATKREAEQSKNLSKGASLYQSLVADRGPRGASAFLAGRGIPGIKYLDEQSRAAGEGTRNFVVFPGEEKNLTILQRNEEKLLTKKAQGGLVGGSMSYTQAADVIADKLIRQGMDPDRAFTMALRMSDARMKAGGAVLMNEGGDPTEEAERQYRMRRSAETALFKPEPVRMRKAWEGPMPNRPVVNGRAMVSAEELADFRRQFGANMTLRDLLNADQGRGPSAAMPAARGVQGANIKPAGARVRPDEAATLPPVGLGDVPGLIMQGMGQGAERVPAGRGAGAAFVGAGVPRAAAQAISGAKLLREHPSISPERRQMLKEMEDYISGLNKERMEPGFAEGGKAGKAKPLVGIAPALRGAARTEARLAAKKAAEEAAIAARSPVEKSVVEKFGQKQEQEAARAKRVEQLAQSEAPQRDVKSAGRRVKVAPDVYRVMAEQQGEDAVLRAARAGEHLKPTPQGYVGAPRTVTNPQALGAMRRAMDKDFADAVEAVRLADPERLGTWYDRAKMGIAESSEPYQLPRVLEQHGVYSAGVSPESELGFSLKHLNTRAMGEPGMAYRGAPMRNLDEAVEQNRPASMGFKIGEYMNKNDPRLPNAGLFGVNDFRRAQGMGYTDPAGNPWKAGVSETMHPFMDAETALQVDRANRGAVGGRTDWAGPHIQEVPWVYGKAQDLYSRGKSGRFGGDELEGIKRSLVEANNTARDYMYKHAASATHEAVPGASLGHVSQVLDMTPEQKAAYGATGRWDLPAPELALSDMPGVGAGPRDVMYGALGLRQLPSRQGSGLYVNSLGGVETNPMTIARPLMDFPTGGGGLMAPLSRKTMEATEGLRALLDAQEAGAFNLPNTMPSVKDKNSLVLDTRGRNPDRLSDPSAGILPTSEQLARMNEVMGDTGFGVSATNRGAVVFPYDPATSAKDAAKVFKSKQKALTEIFPSTPERSLSTMGYVPGVGKRGQFGPEPTAPFSGEATIDKLLMLSELPQEVARSLGESEAIRAQIREKALRDAKLGGTRRDIQETRRFFSEADWPKAIEMIRNGMTPAAALAALGYSASAMAEQAP